MFNVRQQVMRDLHAWIEELKDDLVKISDRQVMGDFHQHAILDWNEAMLIVMGEWPCHDELQKAVFHGVLLGANRVGGNRVGNHLCAARGTSCLGLFFLRRFDSQSVSLASTSEVSTLSWGL